MSATNSRTPRIGVPNRTRGVRNGAAGIDRQRPRADPMSHPIGQFHVGQPQPRRSVFGEQQQTNAEGTRKGSGSSGTTALDRARTVGVALPVGQNELKIRVRRKGQAAVPVTVSFGVLDEFLKFGKKNFFN